MPSSSTFTSNGGGPRGIRKNAIVDWLLAALLLIAIGLLIRYQINSALLVAGGAFVSVLVNVLG